MYLHRFFRFSAGLLVLILTGGFVAHAQAQTPSVPNTSKLCAPLLVFNGHTKTPAYNPFAQGAMISDSDIGYQHADCGQSVTVKAAIGWSQHSPRLINNNAALAFNLFVAGRDLTAGDGGLSVADAVSAGAVITLPAEESGILPNLVRLVIPEGQVVPPGIYSLEAPVNTQLVNNLLSSDLNLDPESTFEGGARVLRITAEVLAIMKLGISGCDVSASTSLASVRQFTGFDLASSCKLNLGDPSTGMAHGDIARARLTSLTNINFVIAMTSRNGGVLVPSGLAGGAKETEKIHYSASVISQGRAFDFSCVASVCGQSFAFEPASSPLGTELSFQVRVDETDLNQKRAGIYSDVITLIIQPAS